MSPMENFFSWVGPACILTGSLLAAANAGARWTGYGFIFLTLGAVSFGSLSVLTSDYFGSVINFALVMVNGFGVRRWLGHLAVAEAAASNAQSKSLASEAVPTIAALSKVIGRQVLDQTGEPFGEIADVMVEIETGKLSYFVVHPKTSHVGSGFVGMHPHNLDANTETFVLNASAEQHVLLEDGDWPSRLPQNSA
jgi:sporulation protein YlmC with PRC-barrel domain